MNQKLLERAREASSVKELKALANKEGLKLDDAEAEKYYKTLHAEEGELSDEELNNVSGGSCSSAETLAKEYPPVGQYGHCDHYEHFGSFHRVTFAGKICSNCDNSVKAKDKELYFCTYGK
jgi:bacteriocin-like protein